MCCLQGTPTLLEYYTTPRTNKITPQGESPTFNLMIPVTSLSVTSHPVAMLLPYLWLNPQVGKIFAVLDIFFMCCLQGTPPKNRNIKVVYRDSSRHISGGAKVLVMPFPVRTPSGDVTFSNASVMAGSPLLPPKYALSCPKILLWYLDLGVPYAYPMKNYRRTAKFFATWRLCQRYFPGL
jgi:hypothetical protein